MLGITLSAQRVDGVLLVFGCCDSNKFRRFSVEKSAKVCLGTLELNLYGQTKTMGESHELNAQFVKNQSIKESSDIGFSHFNL